VTTPRTPTPPPPCPVCRKRGCRGHEPYDRCSALVDGEGRLVIDLRGEERTEDHAGRVREGGQGRT